MQQEKIVRVAIVGQGRSGRNIHANTLRSWTDRFHIVAVVDGEEERRSRAVRELGCEAFSSVEALFQRRDIDLVVNAAPSHLHAPISLDLLNHGFHVLCEKPLASSTEQVDALIAAAERSGKVLSVFQQSRYSPSFLKVREVIDSGVLGRIIKINIVFSGFGRRADWQAFKKFNGGELMNTGPHPMDQALQLLGTDQMPEVICEMDLANAFGDAEDYVHVLLKAKQRPAVDVEISSCNAYPAYNYHVQGTNGGLMGTFQQLKWKYFKPEEAPVREASEAVPPLRVEGEAPPPREQLHWYEESSEPTGSPAKTFYTMLYHTLVHGRPLEVTPAQVRQQIAVMKRCFEQNPRFDR
ncbi:MAG: oxidoreductase [Paenibacillus sp.]|nr:oxidoreductase [Paenibacillus sp.]